MPFAENPIDGCPVYFEDDGGEGTPLVIMGGLGRSTVATREWSLAIVLEDGHRRIFIDHRGHGRSGKPGRVDDYSVRYRVADVVSVLDTLGLQQANYLGTSWGARLGFGLGILAAARFTSLCLGGQHPYAMNPAGPVVSLISAAFGSEERKAAFIDRLSQEDVIEGSGRELADAVALAWRKALDEGDIATDFAGWRTPTLIYAGTEDTDFFEDAKRAATEIPGAQFVALEGMNHLQAHENVNLVLPHIRRLLKD